MEHLTQHFRADEKEFLEKCIDKVRNVEQNYVPALTSFLNPREQFILESTIGSKEEVGLTWFGGYEGAERKRGMIYPTYFTPQEADFELTLCQIMYPEKFNQLSHGQILGTLLGTGLERDVLGDILTDGANWQFYIDTKFSRFLPLQVERVGKVPVKIVEKNLKEHIEPEEKWLEKTVIVSSMRLDTVLSAVYPFSRQKAKTWIDSGKVKLNWAEVNNPALTLDEQDMISVRTQGRFRLIQNEGTTKKEKIKLTVEILSAKNK